MNNHHNARQTRRKRITRAALIIHARAMGKDSTAGQALREAKRLDKLGLRSELFMLPQAYHVQTVSGQVYKFA